VAERLETTARPAPRFSGGGPCDPAPDCQPSRLTESVRLGIVPCLPAAYQFTGCLDETGFQLPAVNFGTDFDGDVCRQEVFAFIDNVQNQLATLCCSRPAVVLAHAVLTREPKSLKGSLPDAPLYTILDDGYPCRRPVFQVGLFTKFFPNTVCVST
jgi:hypothetical protein